MLGSYILLDTSITLFYIFLLTILAVFIATLEKWENGMKGVKYLASSYTISKQHSQHLNSDLSDSKGHGLLSNSKNTLYA